MRCSLCGYGYYSQCNSKRASHYLFYDDLIPSRRTLEGNRRVKEGRILVLPGVSLSMNKCCLSFAVLLFEDQSHYFALHPLFFDVVNIERSAPAPL